ETINTFEVSDEAGNSVSCSFTITVNDAELPTIDCPDNIAVNTDPGQCTAVVTFSGVTFDDNCPGETVTQITGLASGAAYPVGVTTNTYVVEDVAGNSTTCAFTVTVSDAQLPVFTACPMSATVVNNPNVCGAVVNYTVTATDNCPDLEVNLTAGLASGSLFPIGSTTVTYVAEDASGNLATCSFTITVLDTQLPTIECSDDISVSTDPGQCTAVVEYDAASGADNCPNFAIAQTGGLVSGSAFPLGINTVEYTVTDASGNTASCTFTIEVRDLELPVVTCPAPISVTNDLGLCSAVVNYTVTFSDNCAGATITQTGGLASGSAFPVGVTNNTFLVTDGAANMASCSFTVTVTDAELPTIQCPNDISVTAPTGQCSAVVSFAGVIYNDNCPGATVTQTSGLASGASYPVGTTVNTYKVEDGAGLTATCAFSVIVSDTEFPVITACPPSATRTNDAGQCGAVVNYPAVTATDNCPDLEIVLVSGLASGSLFPVGMTTTIYEATDASGNVSTCSFTVTVTDTEPPMAVCNDITVELGPDGTYTLDQDDLIALTAGSTDNCLDVLTITAVPNLFDCSDIGLNDITVSISDPGGFMASCTTQVLVADLLAPTWSTGEGALDVTVNCDDMQALADAQALTPAAEDNCDDTLEPVKVSGDFVPGVNCPQAGTYTNTWTVTDDAGNTSTVFTQIITVVDVTPPTVNCPDDLTLECNDPENGDLIAAWLASVTATDACGTATVSNDYDVDNFSDGCGATGSVTVTFSATDECDNTSTVNCVQTITIFDTTPPVVSCPPNDLTLECNDPENAGLIAAWLALASAEDACGTATVGNNYDADNFSDGCGATGAQTVTFTATDECQNMTNCARTIEILDNTPPTINGDCDLLESYGNGINAAAYIVATSGGSVCPGSATVNLAIDQVISDDYEITVGSIVVPGILGCLGDNCSAPENLRARIVDIIEEGDNCIKSFEIRMVVVDECENESVDTISYLIEVDDDTPPTIACPPNDLTLECGNPDNAGLITAWLNSAVATDNCGDATAHNDFNVENFSDGCGATGTQTVTFRATDECQNSSTSTCFATVSILDNTPPTVSCPPADLTLECGNPENGALIDAWLALATAEDNCGNATAGNDYDEENFSDGCGATGIQTVTFRAFDECQNSSTSTCSGTIEI
ncbi:MAG: HYR domain-containing protein, partial [Thermoanaerobaculia bacterium]|nr:HYR domain-containing protein [Thermoanaerobaculia bacterium]